MKKLTLLFLNLFNLKHPNRVLNFPASKSSINILVPLAVCGYLWVVSENQNLVFCYTQFQQAERALLFPLMKYHVTDEHLLFLDPAQQTLVIQNSPDSFKISVFYK